MAYWLMRADIEKSFPTINAARLAAIKQMKRKPSIHEVPVIQCAENPFNIYAKSTIKGAVVLDDGEFVWIPKQAGKEWMRLNVNTGGTNGMSAFYKGAMERNDPRKNKVIYIYIGRKPIKVANFDQALKKACAFMKKEHIDHGTFGVDPNITDRVTDWTLHVDLSYGQERYYFTDRAVLAYYDRNGERYTVPKGKSAWLKI